MSKTALARKLGICRQSLYYVSKLEEKDRLLADALLVIYEDSPWYGHKRLAWEMGVNKKRVLRVMKKFKIRARTRGHKPDKTKDLGNPPTATPNIAKTLCPIRAGVLWAGDFTYLSWHEEFVYLATVLDVHTREIVGWHIGTRHTTDLIAAAFLNAVERSDTVPQIFHSDQGSEYVSGRYGKLLAILGTTASNSKKASPWENGYQESFYSNFKLEFGNPKDYQTLAELAEAIHLHIHYYNTKRLHTALKTTPHAYKLKQRYAANAAYQRQGTKTISFTKNLQIQRETTV